MVETGPAITREEALAALNDPETGSLRVLKAVGRQRDVYARLLAAGEKRLAYNDGFEEVCAEAALKDFLEDLKSEGMPVPADIKIENAALPPPPPPEAAAVPKPKTEAPKKMNDPQETASITKEEALAALNSPETGSLRVLKAVGKQRDLYTRQLIGGQKRLIVRSPFEEVCAEAAIEAYTEDLVSEGMEPPTGITLFRA